MVFVLPGGDGEHIKSGLWRTIQLRSVQRGAQQLFRSAADHTGLFALRRLSLVMVNIANKQGSKEVLRDWLMDGKSESCSGFALDLYTAQAAAQ